MPKDFNGWLDFVTGAGLGFLHLYMFVENSLAGIMILDAILEYILWRNS